MVHNSRIILVIVLLAVISTLISGCHKITTTFSTITTTTTINSTVTVTFPSGDQLPYETIVPSGAVGGGYPDRAGLIRVFTDSQSPTEVSDWIYPYHETTIFQVDYERYLVILVFNGWRGGIGTSTYFRIEKILINNNTVYVLAHFDDGSTTSLPAASSQYQAVMVERKLLAQSGEITFVLLDQTGKERASTVLSA